MKKVQFIFQILNIKIFSVDRRKFGLFAISNRVKKEKLSISILIALLFSISKVNAQIVKLEDCKNCIYHEVSELVVNKLLNEELKNPQVVERLRREFNGSINFVFEKGLVINKKILKSIISKYNGQIGIIFSFPDNGINNAAILNEVIPLFSNKHIYRLQIEGATKNDLDVIQNKMSSYKIDRIWICKIQDVFTGSSKFFKNVTELSIGCSKATEFDLSMFPNLNKLSVNLDDEGLTYPNLFSESLKKLKLREFKVTIGSNPLPMGLETQDSLRHLHVYCNSMKNLEFPKSLRNLRTLTVQLNILKQQDLLDSNNLSYPSSLSYLKSLKELNLFAFSSNSSEKENALLFPSLPKEIGNLSELEELKAHCSTINFPESFAQIKNLKKIKIWRPSTEEIMPASLAVQENAIEYLIHPFFLRTPDIFSLPKTSMLYMKPCGKDFILPKMTSEKFPKLKVISISWSNKCDLTFPWNVDTIDLESLKNFRNDFSLIISGNLIIKGGLQFLAELKYLRCLEMGALNIEYIKSVDEIKVLNSIYFLYLNAWNRIKRDYSSGFPFVKDENSQLNYDKLKELLPDVDLGKYSDVTSIDRFLKQKK